MSPAGRRSPPHGRSTLAELKARCCERCAVASRVKFYLNNAHEGNSAVVLGVLGGGSERSVEQSKDLEALQLILTARLL